MKIMEEKNNTSALTFDRIYGKKTISKTTDSFYVTGSFAKIQKQKLFIKTNWKRKTNKFVYMSIYTDDGV